MPLQKNLNVSPYYADYNPLSDYYKILFKAGYPVQARELTNSQLMMQNQIETFMSRFLKEGDNVIPGEFGYTNSSYVRVSSITQGATAAEFQGYTLTGVTSGVKAFVNLATAETTADDVTFFVSYQSSGSDATQSTFIEGETLESNTPNRYTAVVGVDNISKPTNTPPVGLGSVFTVKEGYYFVDGSSVRNDEQIITLDKYGLAPSYAVGFLVIEEFITANEDPALLDNSQGSSNFAAPGADRLKITLNLQKRGLNDDFTDPNFILLAKIVGGNIEGNPDQTVKWAWLYDILAKRTFDESGDYIVTEFPVQLLEYINTDFVNGVANADADGLYPPVPGNGSDELLTVTEAEGKYVVKLSPGKAYVQGYAAGNSSPAYLYGNKPRTQNFRTDANVQITPGYNIAITSLNSVPDFASINAEINTLGLETIRVYRNFGDGYVGDSTIADAQGFIEPYNIGNEPPVTYHCLFEKGGTLGEITGFNVVYEGEIVNGQLKRGNSCVLANPTSGNPPKRGDTIGGLLCTSVQVINPTPTGLITPKFLTPKAVVTDPQDNSGTLGYNSTYDLGITTAVYFTELFLVDNNSTNFGLDWKVGDIVRGEQTDSQGVVEQGTIPDRLIVSSITGEFAPGENVYQDEVGQDADGNAIPKVSQISREGEVYSFVFTDIVESADATSDLANVSSITVTAINAEITLNKNTDFIYVAAKNNLIPNAEGRRKLRNFPYPEGSVLAQRINYTLLTNTGISGYANQGLGKIQNSVDKAKSFYAPQDEQLVNFTANIAIQSNNDSEIVPLASGSLFSGQAGNNFIKCDDFNGDPAQQVQIGDVIVITDDTGATVNKLVTFATKPVGYGRERDFAYVYFTTTLVNSVTSKTASRIRIKRKGAANETLIFQLPQNTISSLQSDPLASGINYSVMQEFVVSLSGGTNQVPLNTNKQNETFIANLSQTTITVASLPTDSSDQQGILGRQLSIGSFALDNNGREIVFTLNKTIQTPVVLKVMVPVFVQNALAKIKTMNRDQTLTITGEAAKRRVISLGLTDVTDVKSIKMAPNDLDVRDNYSFDDGQRDNVYEISRLILADGSPEATGDLTIVYNYYSHSGDGDFFSVDSYTSDGGVSYGEVPYYVPSKSIPNNNQNNADRNLALGDCVDFRPIVNTTGNVPSYLPVITEPGGGVIGDATLSTNFRTASAYDGNAVVPRFPIAGSLFLCDLAYYMGRIDSLYLEYGGALRLIQGEQSDNPIAPPALATGLKLYDFALPPYTFSVSTIRTIKYNYTRYTMKDIASIDNRVSRVEDLVTLSLLEQSALNMQVRDAVTGLSRFKNGIVVDRFANHGLGSVGNDQYRNSVDPKLSQLRAPFYNDQVELIEAAQTDEQRSGLGYKRSGPFFTVDYENLRFMQNPFATRTINLQPYSVFTYDGSVELTPSVDTFKDITTLPDLVIQDNDLYNAMVNLTGEMADGGMGTVWGDWETTGTVETEIKRTRLGGHPSTISNEQNAARLAVLEAQGVEVQKSKLSPAWQARFARRGWNPPIMINDTITKTEFARQQTQTTIGVSTGSVKDTSYGERVTDVSLAQTMRSIPVRVQAGRLKPNTKYYIFFDEIDCSEWFSVDTIQTGYADGQNRYAGQPGSSQRGFGAPIISDDIGKLTGLFLIPNGRAPVTGSVFTNIQSVLYQGSGSTRSFNTGTRKFRITSSEQNAQDLEIVEGFAETSFTASGVLLDKQETIVSTRLPEFAFSKEVVDTDTRWEESTKRKASYFDPVAQTFLIDKNHPEGLMVTELDVFFRTKDKVEAVEAYLTPTDGQVPTEQIIPFSKVVLESDSILRLIVTNISSGATISIPAGTTVNGNTSGATGIVKATQTFASAGANSTTNNTNTTYNLILDNYNGQFLPGEPLTVTSFRGSATFTIASNTYEIEDVRLTALGSGYTDPTVTFTTPQLPGGVTATGTVKASTSATGQVIYEVTITDKGSGYTQVPAVTFSGGTGAAAEVLVSPGTKAVTMGVCTSDDATAATKFKFSVPVYLLSDTNYSFVLKAPTSLEYTCWTSKLGENEVGTQTRVSQQPNLGSLFKSQNGGLWTEDQTQDIKFILYRAQYDTNVNAQIRLLNAPLKPRTLPLNPIETNSVGQDASSDIFGVNPQVIRVESLYHGLAPNDFVAINGISNNPGGIPNAEINTLHTVLDAGIGYFTVKVATSATNNERDGGSLATYTPNKPYEVINVYTGAMPFASGTLIATNRATQAAGVTGYNVNNQYKIDLPNEIKLMDSYYYNGARQVANQINESKYNGSTQLRGNKSLETTITLATINNEVSPVVDFDRTNANLIRNLIDNPIADDSAVGARTAIVSLKSRTTDLALAAGNKFSYTNDGVTYDAFVKSYNSTTGKIRLTGSNLNKLNGATFANSVVQSIGADITTTNGMLFHPETSPDGSVYAKWLSRQFLFENPCDGMELKLTVVQYEKTSIRAYYRPRAIGFEVDITQQNWTPFNPEQTLDVTNAQGQVTPTLYPGLPDNINNVTIQNDGDVDPRGLGPSDFANITFTVQDIPAFDAIEIKIVMTAENPANTPLVDDMILVCSE